MKRNEKLLNWKKLFSFRAYDDQLLTKKANYWLMTAQTTVLIIATIESLSWAYFGSLLGDSWFSKGCFALLIGTFTFLMIWSLDATLMTLDRGKAFYKKRLSTAEGQEADESEAEFWKFFKKNELTIGVGIRILMLTVSICITAPFLNQLVFNKEINAVIKRTGNGIIAKKREALVSNYDQQIKTKTTEADKLKTALNTELAGKGLTGKYGDGVVSKDLKRQIADKASELAKASTDKSNTLLQFDKLVVNGDFNALQENYGIVVPQNSLSARGEAIKPILASEDAKRFEVAIRSFLGFLFLGLILLKFYEPSGVRIYFSEDLQQAFQRYKTGAFDPWIKSEERYNGKSPMDTLRFEEWMLTTYVDRNKEAEQSDQKVQLEKKLEDINHDISRLEEERAAEEARIHDELVTAKEVVNTAEKELKRARKELNDLKFEASQCLSQIEKCNESIKTTERLMVIGNESVSEQEAKALMQIHMQDRAEQKTKRELWFEKLRSFENSKTIAEGVQEEASSLYNTCKAAIDKLEGPLKKFETALSYARDLKRQLILDSLNNIIRPDKPEDPEEPLMKAV